MVITLVLLVKKLMKALTEPGSVNALLVVKVKNELRGTQRRGTALQKSTK